MPRARAVGFCSITVVPAAAEWKNKNASGSTGQINSIKKDGENSQ